MHLQSMKKNMQRYLCIFLLMLGSVTLVTCSREEDKPFTVSYDLLQELREHIQEATAHINFRQAIDHQKYLLHGWSHPGEITWATGKTSSLLFYSYSAKKDLEIEIQCVAIASKDHQEQRTEVLVNDISVGTFVVLPHNLQTFRLLLPATSLKSGQNILQFRFSYTTKPKDIDPSSIDERPLSVAFQSILFTSNDHLIYADDTKIIQKASSELQFFRKLPDKTVIEIQYHSEQGVESSLEIISQSRETTTLSLSAKKTSYKKQLPINQKGLYKLRFITEGSSNSQTIWENIQLHTYQQENLEHHEQQGFSQLKKPDILLYVVDTLRADHVSCYGYERTTTPNLDKFAKENSLFQNAYTVTSWTRASAANILTGLFPKHNKTMTLEDKLPENVVTLAEIFPASGSAQ